jgi:hypothetical protein
MARRVFRRRIDHANAGYGIIIAALVVIAENDLHTDT